MKVIHFNEMSVNIPIKGNEAVEDVEDKIIDAIGSIGNDITMRYKIETEEYNDDQHLNTQNVTNTN